MAYRSYGFDTRPVVLAFLFGFVSGLAWVVSESGTAFLLELLFYVGAACLTVLVLIVAVFRRSLFTFLTTLFACLVFWLPSIGLIAYNSRHLGHIRSIARWSVKSHEYKALVLNQPTPPGHQLKHVDWDGWGMFAMDTNMYLVYDPADALEPAAKSGQPGQYPGLPKPVWQVSRMEDHWYTVVFFTDEGWEY